MQVWLCTTRHEDAKRIVMSSEAKAKEWLIAEFQKQYEDDKFIWLGNKIGYYFIKTIEDFETFGWYDVLTIDGEPIKW